MDVNGSRVNVYIITYEFYSKNINIFLNVFTENLENNYKESK